MRYKEHPHGIYFAYDKTTWKANHKAFWKAIIKLKTFMAAPEIGDLDDPDDRWFFVGKQDLEAFYFYKEKYIDKILKDQKDAPPLKRNNSRFNRKRIV